MMAKLITPLQRIEKARQCIQMARELQAPQSAGWESLSYVAQVKEKLREAFELVKLIPFSPSAADEVKRAAKELIEEAKKAEGQILRPEKKSDAS
ncbi:MAG: hypothetical protein VB108_02435 [Anaerolineaceae bacterium]|nr:hypothetical protein [Anaerolineaceae bacterium]